VAWVCELTIQYQPVKGDFHLTKLCGLCGLSPRANYTISTSQRRLSFSLQAVHLPTELSGIQYVASSPLTNWAIRYSVCCKQSTYQLSYPVFSMLQAVHLPPELSGIQYVASGPLTNWAIRYSVCCKRSTYQLRYPVFSMLQAVRLPTELSGIQYVASDPLTNWTIRYSVCNSLCITGWSRQKI
jgi:hypothetical protein